MTKHPRLALMVSDTHRAEEAARLLRAEQDFVPLAEAEAAVVLGGDGHMLHVLHQMLDEDRVIPAYGLNLGTVGFLSPSRAARWPNASPGPGRWRSHRWR
jgi:NAD+ kinase